MRKEGFFNFDSLSKGNHKVTIADCQNLQEYAKVLFENQNYESKWSILTYNKIFFL